MALPGHRATAQSKSSAVRALHYKHAAVSVHFRSAASFLASPFIYIIAADARLLDTPSYEAAAMPASFCHRRRVAHDFPVSIPGFIGDDFD